MVSSENYPVPVIDNRFETFYVKDFHCGQLDMIIKGENDKIYLCGKRFFYNPTLREGHFGNVVSINSGKNHYTVINDKHEIYSWGELFSSNHALKVSKEEEEAN